LCYVTYSSFIQLSTAPFSWPIALILYTQKLLRISFICDCLKNCSKQVWPSSQSTKEAEIRKTCFAIIHLSPLLILSLIKLNLLKIRVLKCFIVAIKLILFYFIIFSLRTNIPHFAIPYFLWCRAWPVNYTSNCFKCCLFSLLINKQFTWTQTTHPCIHTLMYSLFKPISWYVKIAFILLSPWTSTYKLPWGVSTTSSCTQAQRLYV